MPQVGSTYPGGPSREGTNAPTRGPLSSEERHDRGHAHHRRRRDRKRRTATFAVIGVAFVAAAAMGYLLGDQASGESAEGTAEGRDALTTEEFLSSELNRVLMELWEMESLEAR